MADSRNNPVYFGSNAARAGSTLGQGLEALAAAKLKQHQTQQFQNQLKKFNVSPEGAEFISSFQDKPEILKSLFENLGMFQNQAQSGAQGLPMDQQSWQPNAFTGGGQQTPGLEQFQNGLPGGQELGQGIAQLGRQVPSMGQQPNQQQPFNPFESAAARRAKDQTEIAKENLKTAKSAHELAKEAAIVKENKPDRDILREDVRSVEPVIKVTDEIKELMSSPDIQWGSIKSLTPQRFQNAPTQALVSKFAELVILKSQLGKGVPHRARLALENLAKPNLSLDKAAAEYLVDSIHGGASEVMLKKDIEDQLIERNGGEPKNLSQTLKNYYRVAQELPPVSRFENGDILEAGKFRFINNQGRWEIA